MVSDHQKHSFLEDVSELKPFESYFSIFVGKLCHFWWNSWMWGCGSQGKVLQSKNDCESSPIPTVFPPACPANQPSFIPFPPFLIQVRLAVAGAFHTHFMAPAVGKLEEALASTTIVTPRIPVISNVDVKPHSDPETIRKTLALQVKLCSIYWFFINNLSLFSVSTDRWLLQCSGKLPWKHFWRMGLPTAMSLGLER